MYGKGPNFSDQSGSVLAAGASFGPRMTERADMGTGTRAPESAPGSTVKFPKGERRGARLMVMRPP